MFQKFMDLLTGPALIFWSLAVTAGFAIIIQEHLENKRYTSALIETIIAAILSWPSAILIALYVGWKLSKKKEASPDKEPEQPEPERKYEPQPGSTEHYQRWKAERENDGG